MQKLLDGKKRYREMTGKEWNAKLVEDVLTKQKSALPPPPAGATSADALLLEIKAVGDRVRDLKAQKADKVSCGKHICNKLVSRRRRLKLRCRSCSMARSVTAR